MPRKRIWIPLLSLLIIGVLVWYRYQQLPNYTRHNEPITLHVGQDRLMRREWLKRHQSNDGRWSACYYQYYCDEAQRDDDPPSAFCSAYANDVSYTSLALLSFYDAGFDRHTGSYGKVVARGLNWLIAQGSANGWYSDDTRAQALASMVLAEAAGMEGDAQLERLAALACDQLHSRMLTYSSTTSTSSTTSIVPTVPIIGWSAQASDTQAIDFSVTAWAVMALRSMDDMRPENKMFTQQLIDSYKQSWTDQHSAGQVDDQEQHFAQRLDLVSGGYSGVNDACAAWPLSYFHLADDDPLLEKLRANVVQRLRGDMSQLNGLQLYMATLVIFCGSDQGWYAFTDKKCTFEMRYRGTPDCACGSAPKDYFRGGNQFLDTVSLFLMSSIYHRIGRVRVAPRPKVP